MKDLLKRAVGEEVDLLRRRNLAREYLQARILLSLQDQGAFTEWAFVGGTALRFLFNLPRYSEDIDFSLVRQESNANFQRRMREVRSALAAEAYDVQVRSRERPAVCAAMIKFRGLLFELGLSPHREEVLSIKVELDARPPAGAAVATRLLRRHFLLNLMHYDRASLLAGKLHAVLQRTYTKGRDLYDLAWYLADPAWPEPNLVLLNHALAQTGWPGPPALPETWRAIVRERLQRVDWGRAVQDVRPFLERKQDESLLNLHTLEGLLG